MAKNSVSAAYPLVLCGSRVAVEFIKLADRFAHRVLLGEDGATWRPILETVEAGANSHCPPSPALQQLHRSEREASDGEAILLVGGAGSNHWSACISVDEHNAGLTFDVACRSRGPAAWLGSTYRLAAGVQAELHPGRILLTTPSDRVVLTALPTVDAASGAASLRLGSGSVEIVAAAAVGGEAVTTRWRYSMERSSSENH